jgi:hypothetical protein
MAVAASTVADLHALGLVHGRVDPDHVVLTGSGRGCAGSPRPSGRRPPRRRSGARAVARCRRSPAAPVLAGRPETPTGARIDRSAAARFADGPRDRPSAAALGPFAAGLGVPPCAHGRTAHARSRPTCHHPITGGRSVAEPAPAPRHRRHRRQGNVGRRRGLRALAVAGAAIAGVARRRRRCAGRPPRAGADFCGVTGEHPVRSSSRRRRPGGGLLDIDGHHVDPAPRRSVVLPRSGVHQPSAVVQPARRVGVPLRPAGDTGPGRHRRPGRSVPELPVQLVTGADGCLALQARAGDRTETLSIPAAPPRRPRPDRPISRRTMPPTRSAPPSRHRRPDRPADLAGLARLSALATVLA